MKSLYAYLAILFISLGLSAETRSVWVLPWDMQSPRAIDQVIDDALLYEQNELLLEVRYRSDALYQPNRVSDLYPNPEPRSYILSDDGFDPLAYAIQEAKKHGIRIQAWVVVFNATPLDKELIAKNYIYQNHRDWITLDDEGKPMRSTAQFGYFIDPGIPAVQDYLLDVFSDLVSGYPELDGLHLDYLRYPTTHLGYHPQSVQRYQNEAEDLSWNEWRIKQITNFVTKCQQRIKQINPDIILSAAVFADINAARDAYAQDWYAWLKSGIIDLAYPMAYHLDYSEYCKQISSMKRQKYADRIVVGLRAWEKNGNSLLSWASPDYNVSHIYERIALARKSGFQGIALFSYNGLKQGDAFAHLASLAYPPIRLAYDFPSQAFLSDQAQFLASSIETDQIPDPESTTNKLSDHQTSALDLSLSREDGFYVLHFSLPCEGRWQMQVLDEKGELIYDRHRYYFTDSIQDYWDGILNDGRHLTNGKYHLLFTMEDLKLQTEIRIGDPRDE